MPHEPEIPCTPILPHEPEIPCTPILPDEPETPCKLFAMYSEYPIFLLKSSDKNSEKSNISDIFIDKKKCFLFFIVKFTNNVFLMRLFYLYL